MNFMAFLPIICGITAANIYYIQPLVPVIQHALHISYVKASMLYSFSLAGNALSLVFIIPLGDFFKKKMLMMVFYIMLIFASVIIFFSKNYYVLSLMYFFLGTGTSVIPLIISSASNTENGSVYIGRIMAGVLVGILSSRFLSGEISMLYGWKSIYIISACMMLVSCIFTVFACHFVPTHYDCRLSYFKIIKKSVMMVFKNRLVTIYCTNAFIIMFILSAFWSNVSMYLTTSFNFNQYEIGLFSLVGIAGAFSAWFSSWILKLIHYNNKILYLLMTLSLLFMAFYPTNLWCTLIGTVLIDAFIQLLHVNNQRNLYSSCKGKESQAASCYMACFIIGGATGGFITSYLYSEYGWNYIMMLCVIISLFALSISSRNLLSENN